ncbi:putative N6-adenine-specific DNA methylase [Gulbenkiania mobilis]|uniref:N6-adenine-specific DNA methylase n=2 Tax=Gulbenkiania mobilis TaxID=397457 RepID=A0ABY2CZ70_GULMO|nr:putative N6-adenine-specific DNA methylase [Gulbenkiania mobilis]
MANFRSRQRAHLRRDPTLRKEGPDAVADGKPAAKGPADRKGLPPRSGPKPPYAKDARRSAPEDRDAPRAGKPAQGERNAPRAGKPSGFGPGKDKPQGPRPPYADSRPAQTGEAPRARPQGPRPGGPRPAYDKTRGAGPQGGPRPPYAQGRGPSGREETERKPADAAAPSPARPLFSRPDRPPQADRPRNERHTGSTVPPGPRAPYDRSPSPEAGERPRALFSRPRPEGQIPPARPDAEREARRPFPASRPPRGDDAPLAQREVASSLQGRLAMFAPCPRGLEEVLATELAAVGASDIRATEGGVGFAGDMATLMRANLESRTASRILVRLAEGGYRTEDDLYRLALAVDWPRFFDVDRTIKIKTDGIGSTVRSLDFVSLKVKDAVCDRFRQARLGRPSVDTRSPDIRLQMFLRRDRATLYLDTSGEALFKRGWREETGEAPLRENLAAGILLLAGYDGTQSLLDPMCGSGTFLVEAADIALNRAPGRLRQFAFERLRNFDAVTWESVRTAARLAERPAVPLAIRGSDRDPAMVEIARRNLAHAGLEGCVVLTVAEVTETRPDAPSGLIVTNPPYGVRLEEQAALVAWYPELGSWLKQYFAGWTAHFLTADAEFPGHIRLSPKRRTPLYNGSLACRLYGIRMVEGSARREKAEPTE